MRAPLLSLLIALAAAGLAGCKSSASGGRTADALPHLDEEAARAAGFSAQEITTAREIYVTKCAKCHKFYEPAAYSQKDWDDWMRKMSRKSRLKPAQEALLTRYLNEFRAKAGTAEMK